MASPYWNPQVDEIINEVELDDSDIKTILRYAPTAFDSPWDNPVWYQEIAYKLPARSKLPKS